MKTKNLRTFNQPIPTLLRTLIAFIILLGFSCFETIQDENHVLKYSSGDDEIDQIRKEIKLHPTNENNYELRGSMLRLWESSLRQQGAITAGRFTPVNIRLKISSIQDTKEKQAVLARYAKLIEEGYLILDSIQNEIIEDPSKGLTPLTPDPKTVIPPVKNEMPWPNYQGTLSNVGFNGNDGPVYGRIAWKFPVGLAWESRPVIEGDRVYLTSPGLRNILFTLDINTGEVIKSAKQMPGRTYSTPAYASTPVVLKDHILIREMGSRGYTGDAKEIAFINRNTLEVEQQIFAGHIDYRTGYAPLAANEKHIVYPFSNNHIERIPAEAQAFNHIICKDTKTGELIKDVQVGPTFAEPLLDDDMVFIGTMDGYVYCFDASEKDIRYTRAVMARDLVVTWQFKAGDAVNRRVATDAKQVYFGANDGVVYCLNKETGDLIWKYTVEKPVPESFRHFSTPLVSGNKIFIGSADKNLYCLNASSGELIFKHESSDWVRACPVASETNVYFASINGDLYNIDYSGKKPKEVWTKRVGNHWVYADLAMSGNKLIVNNSDLYSYCIDTKKGDILWRFSIIKSFHQKDGYRVLTDQLAGGGYYQSKPTAADGKIFIGTPSRFVYATDAETGNEIWKYEIGAAISGAPVFDNNKIYIGQQGGEDDFYCLDANTGKLIWKQNVGWVWGSAAVSDGLVFVPGIDGYVNCLDANNGNIIWRYRTDKSVCSEPLIIGEHVYFGSWDSFLYKFEKKTGKLVWRLPRGGSDSGVAIGFDGKLIIPHAGMSCFDQETSKLLWEPELTGRIQGSLNGTPAYHDGQLFISTWAGQLFALDTETRKINWLMEGIAGITAAVVGNNGYVYSGARNNPYFYALKEKGKGDGSTETLFRIRLANALLESTPALYRGRAYILSSGGYLYAIE
ncbi:PQQ-binding-like beta-propeller repeat protein [Bacteroidota bacterium]